MTSINDHPAVLWAGFVLAVVSFIVMCVAAYYDARVSLQNLERSTNGVHEKIIEESARISKQIETRNAEKRALDRDWLQSDSDQAQAIQAQIQILRERLNVDASLMYQIGLRDGQRLCIQ